MQHSQVLGNLRVQRPQVVLERTWSAPRLLGVHCPSINPEIEPEQDVHPEENFCTAVDGTSAAVALVLYLVFMAGSEGKALAKTEEKGFQCLCISTRSKFIPPKAIQNPRLSQRGPRCKNVDITATLKGGRRVRAEATAPWVRLTVKAIVARSRDNTESPTKEKSRNNTPWSFSRI
ncbi:PREDICTED: interleukin-8-like [Nipponia nippon]|uniref:interleukin-8-like n=1 Tax=Nipponia nippon TaxID=128390 RepID=UPI000510F290|nr:PREDICTED: interleukin-8-like [Nipponia nippon]